MAVRDDRPAQSGDDDGKGGSVLVDLPPLLLAAVDRWRAMQAGRPDREEAVRLLVEEALAGSRRYREVRAEDEDRRVRSGEGGANDD